MRSACLFGEADAEARDAEPDSELAADAMGMDVEGDTEGAAATTEGGMIVNDDGATITSALCACSNQTYPHLESVKKVYWTVGPHGS